MLIRDVPALILAPMDGVTDAPMRAVQGETGAFTFAVSEFVRVSQEVPPKGVFHRYVPELRDGFTVVASESSRKRSTVSLSPGRGIPICTSCIAAASLRATSWRVFP